jgi:hypothetical protein|tara:strand:+ start:715 stop:978 length:264 start_codon:yes stop_codon:yes gene_type:complete
LAGLLCWLLALLFVAFLSMALQSIALLSMAFLSMALQSIALLFMALLFMAFLSMALQFIPLLRASMFYIYYWEVRHCSQYKTQYLWR